MAPIARLAERRWRKLRSEHARTLEGLESAMRAHPAGRGRTPQRVVMRNVEIVRDDNSNDAA